MPRTVPTVPVPLEVYAAPVGTPTPFDATAPLLPEWTRIGLVDGNRLADPTRYARPDPPLGALARCESGGVLPVRLVWLGSAQLGEFLRLRSRPCALVATGDTPVGTHRVVMSHVEALEHVGETTYADAHGYSDPDNAAVRWYWAANPLPADVVRWYWAGPDAVTA